MKRNIIAIILVLCSCIAGTSQDLYENDAPILDSLKLVRSSIMVKQSETSYAAELPSVTLPSPSSFQFMKYGEHAPSYALGRVNVSIPLHTLQLGSFELPISLQYSTNGIKVMDSPCPIGYGWTLHPGIRVSRIIFGRADEQVGGVIPNIPDNLSFDQQIEYYRDLSSDFLISKLRDSKYDIFSVSLPNESFNFVIIPHLNYYKAVSVGSSAEIELVGKTSTKTSEIFEIKIKDSNGVKYHFGGENYIESNLSYGTWPTTWLLKKITLPNSHGDINFSWRRVSFFEPIDYFTYEIRDGLQDQFCSGDCPNMGFMDNYSRNYAGRNDVNSGYYLSNISSSAFDISFNYIKGLSSMTENYMNKIVIKNSHSDTIKTISFERATGKYEERLLKSLNISDEGRYSFVYNSQRFNNLYAQDHWGYYNGEDSNTELVPKMTFKSKIESNNITFGNANRNVSPQHMMANVLTQIEYPTGGYTLFEYEPHQYKSSAIIIPELTDYYASRPNTPIATGGGLRLAKKINKESKESPPIETAYHYRTGMVVIEPTIDMYLKDKSAFQSSVCERFVNPYTIEYYKLHNFRQTIVSPQPDINEFLLFDSPIWYPDVTEIVNNTSKITYTYKYPSVEHGGHHIMGCYGGIGISRLYPKIYPYRINTYGQPLLQQKTIYKYIANDHIFEEQQVHKYTYADLTVSKENLYVHLSSTSLDSYDGHFWSNETSTGACLYGPSPIKESGPGAGGFWEMCGDCPIPYYGTAKYYVELTKYYQTQEDITIHEAMMPYENYQRQTQTTSCSYIPGYGVFAGNSDRNYWVLRVKSNTSSTGTLLKEQYKYPWDSFINLPSELVSKNWRMVDNNLVETPVQKQIFNNNKIVANKVIQYNTFTNQLILPQIEFYSTKDDAGEPRINYHLYDSYGNPIYLTKDHLINIVYIWGYKGQYPIAEIKNATYEQVKIALGNVPPEDLSAAVTPNQTQLNNLRTHTSLKDASITTYTYKPLVGILSITNPKGVISSYSYDTNNRLGNVSFIDNGITKRISSYQYKSKNEPYFF